MSKNFFDLLQNMTVTNEQYIDSGKKYHINESDCNIFQPHLVHFGHLLNFQSWKITYHKHDFLELCFVINGKCKITIDDKEYIGQNGDIFIFNPNTKHMEYKYNKSKAEMYFFAVDHIQLNGFEKNQIISPSENPVINAGNLRHFLNINLMELMIQINSDDLYQSTFIDSLTKMILIIVLRLLSNNSTENIVNDSIKKMIEYIDNNFSIDLDLDVLSSYISYSRSYFSRLFKEQTGISPIKYIQDKRLKAAKDLLDNSDLSIVKISEKVGFHSVTYFCQIFKTFYSTTPSEYRESHKIIP